jgi:hypothetical protein
VSEGGPGVRPVHGPWPRASVAVALLGLSVLAAACNGLKPSVPFPSVPAQACQPVLNQPVPGSPAPAIDWHVAVEMDRPEGSAILFVSGGDALLCFVSRSSGGSLGGVESGSGGLRVSGPGLTLDLGMGTPKAQVQDLLTGRVPTGTTTVKVSAATGAEDVAAVANGYYLAWLTVPAVPVQIDALDSSGHLLQRLADPNGLQIPS